METMAVHHTELGVALATRASLHSVVCKVSGIRLGWSQTIADQVAVVTQEELSGAKR